MRVGVVDHVADRPGVGRVVVELRLAARRPAHVVDHPVELGDAEGLAEHSLEHVDDGLEAEGVPERGARRLEDRGDRRARRAVVVPEDNLVLAAEGVGAHGEALVDREHELIEHRLVVVQLERRARHRLDHPLKDLLLRLDALLEEHVEHQHEVEQQAPHVGVAVTLAADRGLQEGSAVADRLAVELAVHEQRGEVRHESGEKLADHQPLVVQIRALLAGHDERREGNEQKTRLEGLVLLVDQLVSLRQFPTLTRESAWGGRVGIVHARQTERRSLSYELSLVSSAKTNGRKQG